ncbi:hypothetical protein BKA70DRAFT_1230533 [Coprinopsis sp. MPI-PUGE-AT-0042]|nr:hypothetical protein BKA70DRAFT_1230533 [Coprinopsis sp. MPI-PUGE-AT-0042]
MSKHRFFLLAFTAALSDLSSRRGTLASSFPFPFIRLPPSSLYPRSFLQASLLATTSAEPHLGIAQLWHQLGTMEPPTSVLPGIKKVPTTPHDELRKSAEYVRTIYNPPLRGSRRRKAIRASSHTTQSGDAVRKSSDGSRTSEEEEGSVVATANATGQDRGREALDKLRSDTFERNYFIWWLTSVVAYLSGVLEEEEHEEQELELDDSQMGEEEMVKKEIAEEKQIRRETQRLLADTSALLAICAGTASAGVISCVFAAHSPLLVSLAASPPTLDPTNPTIASTDTSSCLPPNQYPCRARDTGGACVMTEMVVEDPTRFGLFPLWDSSGSSFPGEGLEEKEEARQSPFRILELGAGTGLVSLAVASFYRALFSRDPHTSQPVCGRRDVEIVATDHYPSVLDNLEVNLQNNGSGRVDTKPLVEHRTESRLEILPPGLVDLVPPEHGLFDVAFGADIVYEEHRAVWIKGCLKMLHKPLSDAGTTGKVGRGDKDHSTYFHLIIPLRSTHTFESGTIETVFRSVLHLQATDGDRALREVGDAEMDLAVLEKETIICEVEEGEEDIYDCYRLGGPEEAIAGIGSVSVLLDHHL